MLDLLNGYQTTCILVAAVQLKVFQNLSRAPKDLPSLARDCSVSLDTVTRLVRALTSLGLLRHTTSGVGLAPDGELFADVHTGLDDVAVLTGGQYLRAWSALAHALLTGRPSFEHVFGMSVWEHRKSNAELNACFNRMVERPQTQATAAIVAAYDFSRFDSIADVGGGNGYLLAAILERRPEATGVLFDLPHVVDDGKAYLDSAKVGSRCRTEAGSFFDGVPSGVGLHVLQYVLHNWSDEQCFVILRHCREAMRPDGTLLILEKAMPNGHRRANRALVKRDLHMMAVLGGRERTLSEYDSLLRDAGLRRTAHVPQPNYIPDVIEARIAD